MNTATQTDFAAAPRGWFGRAEAWLDERGKGAWIATMVLGFIFVWPVGLALLAYMIWSKKMFCSAKRHSPEKMMAHRNAHYARRHGFHTSGNTAFDAYKAETLKRLMDEQEAFESFLDRLRAAKDKSEFDQFMDERAETAQAADEDFSEDDYVDGEIEDVEVLDEPKRSKKKN